MISKAREEINEFSVTELANKLKTKEEEISQIKEKEATLQKMIDDYVSKLEEQEAKKRAAKQEMN